MLSSPDLLFLGDAMYIYGRMQGLVRGCERPSGLGLTDGGFLGRFDGGDFARLADKDRRFLVQCFDGSL